MANMRHTEVALNAVRFRVQDLLNAAIRFRDFLRKQDGFLRLSCQL